MDKRQFSIIEVIPTWPAEIFIQRHVKAVLDDGLPVRLAARHASQRFSERASIQPPLLSPTVYEMPPYRGENTVRRVLKLAKLGVSRALLERHTSSSQWLTQAFFERLKPDLIHFHNAQLAASYSWVCEPLGCPYTVSLRGADVQEIPLRSRQVYNATLAAVLSAAGIHTVCKELGQFAANAGRDFETIYTPVPAPENLPPYPSLGKDRMRLLTVGRIHWRKGLTDLLAALRELRDGGVDAQLTIAGNGPDEERVRHQTSRLRLEPFVRFAGKVSVEKMRDLLAESHAYVQSSLVEGLSNAMVEAMAWGCPVFATNVGGTNEVIKNGENAYLLAPLKPETWAEKISLAQDHCRMLLVRENAYKSAKETFNPALHGGKFRVFFENAISQYRGREHPESPRSTNVNELKRGDPNTMEPDNGYWLIRGDWVWQNGIDQILRSLAGPARERGRRILVSGSGEQEDELRYTTQMLGLDAGDIVMLPAGDLQAGERLGRWQDRAEMTLVVERGKYWKITRGSSRFEITIGDIDGLREWVIGKDDG